jgi:hypothetical protein
MKTSKELINALEAAGITEHYRLQILIAIEKEKLDIEEKILKEIENNFNAIKNEI